MGEKINMSKISIELSDMELELFYNLVSEEIEMLSMDFDEKIFKDLRNLRKRILQKRVFLLQSK